MSKEYLKGVNRVLCERILNSPDIEKRSTFKSLLQSRLCNESTKIDHISEFKDVALKKTDGVIHMSHKQKNTESSKQSIENLNRRSVANMSEAELLRELLSEIRALREIAQFGITKDEYEGKIAMFDC